jgi:antitoxin HicB
MVAWQLLKTMKKEKINKVEMERRMRTSRAALDRLLAPHNTSVTLQTSLPGGARYRERPSDRDR